MIGANVMWGLMSPVAKLVMASGAIAPLLLTDFRAVGAAILFWLAATLAGSHERVSPTDLLLLAGAAMLGIVCNQGCFIFGVGLTSPGEASIITTTMPMWVMILAALILREPITLLKAGGIVVGATGAVILIFSNAPASSAAGGSNPLAGDLLVLAAQFSYALYLTLYRNFIKRYSLLTLMKWMFLFAAIVVTAASLPTIAATPWSELTSGEIGGSAFVVVGGTFLAYIGIMTGQKVLRPTVVGIYNYLQPVVASAVGVALGFDSFTPLKCVAVALIFSGVFMVTKSRAAASDPSRGVDGRKIG